MVFGVTGGDVGELDDSSPLTNPPIDVDAPPDDEPLTIRDNGCFATASTAVTTPMAVPNTTTAATAILRQRSECPTPRSDDHSASTRPASPRPGPAGAGPGGGGIVCAPVCLKEDGSVCRIAR